MKTNSCSWRINSASCLPIQRTEYLSPSVLMKVRRVYNWPTGFMHIIAKMYLKNTLTIIGSLMILIIKYYVHRNLPWLPTDFDEKNIGNLMHFVWQYFIKDIHEYFFAVGKKMVGDFKMYMAHSTEGGTSSSSRNSNHQIDFFFIFWLI